MFGWGKASFIQLFFNYDKRTNQNRSVNYESQSSKIFRSFIRTLYLIDRFD